MMTFGIFLPNHAQRMLIETYRRLLQLPRQADGMRFATIATIATYELRLMDLQFPGRVDTCSLGLSCLISRPAEASTAEAAGISTKPGRLHDILSPRPAGMPRPIDVIPGGHADAP